MVAVALDHLCSTAEDRRITELFAFGRSMWSMKYTLS